jgi:flagellin
VQAQKVLDEAIRQVSTLRGRLGALQRNVLETNSNSLSVALENVTASESAIRDADFAKETAELTRAQILVQANTSVVAQANSSPQSVLSLLG